MKRLFIVIIGIIIFGILVFAIKNSESNSAYDTTLEATPEPTIIVDTPTPALIECFVNGKSVYATREDCEELSKQTPVVQQRIMPPPPLPPAMRTCYQNGPWTNCY